MEPFSAAVFWDARIWQALIAGTFLAVGWLVNGWQNRRDAARLRDEKKRDYHRAIYAEIGTALANMRDGERIRDHGETIIARMREGESFVPFVPRERTDHVFDTLLPEIHILPRQTIDPVVQYYTQVKATEALAEDMRGRRFPTLSQERRIAIYGDYIEMKVQSQSFGRFALHMIASYAAGGAVAADEEAARISSRAGGPSGR